MSTRPGKEGVTRKELKENKRNRNKRIVTYRNKEIENRAEEGRHKNKVRGNENKGRKQ